MPQLKQFSGPRQSTSNDRQSEQAYCASCRVHQRFTGRIQARPGWRAKSNEAEPIRISGFAAQMDESRQCKKESGGRQEVSPPKDNVHRRQHPSRSTFIGCPCLVLVAASIVERSMHNGRARTTGRIEEHRRPHEFPRVSRRFVIAPSASRIGTLATGVDVPSPSDQPGASGGDGVCGDAVSACVLRFLC